MTRKPVNPGIRMCPACFRADDVSYPTPAPDGGWEAECCADHDGSGPHAFVIEADTGGRRGGVHSVPAGVTDDLLEPLRACFRAGDGWLEYGVVESRLREEAPEVFARHVREAGHRMFGSKANTASCRISMTLRRLRSQGYLERYIDASTGEAWEDNPISFWARTPPASREQVLTWVQHRAEIGLGDEWDDVDRDGLGSPSQRREPGDAHA